MRKFVAGLMVFAALAGLFTAGAIVGDYRAEAKAAAVDEKAGAKDLTVRSLTVVDADGRTRVSVKAEDSYAGVWVSDPCDSGKNVAIYWAKGMGPVVSLMTDGTKPSAFGVSVTDGDAYIQVVGKDGKIHVIPAKNLAKK